MEVQITNTCSIVAMRNLLDNPNWGPEEFCWMIYQDGGLLAEKTILLETYAPVKVWFGGGLSGDQDVAEIYNDSGKQALSPNEKIIVSYATGNKTAHMVCIQVRDLVLYAGKSISGIVTRKDSIET